MVLGTVASRLLPALAVAVLATAALPASAQAQCSPCGYAAPQPVYVPQVVYVPQIQYGCGHCGNRGLFTSAWVAPAPCGYNPCQPAYAPEPTYAPQPRYYAPETETTEDDDDDYTYRRRVHTGPRYRTGVGIDIHRRSFTSTRRTRSRECGYINGKWTCVSRVSHNQPMLHHQGRRTTVHH
jgi:hypothetical protein